MTLLTILSVLASGVVYFGFSLYLGGQAKTAEDLLPIGSKSKLALVFTSREFNAATVAPTISLATVILAFSQLAPSLGTWLLWSVLTTAFGLFVVRVFAKAIWKRVHLAPGDRLTLHEFLGASYNSGALRTAAALCTSFGFLGAFAVEITIGTKFIAALAPGVPEWTAITLLVSLGVGYTIIGGFRAVVLTDRIQMAAIWCAIFCLAGVIAWRTEALGGLRFLETATPRAIYDFSWRPGLLAFLIGIFVINVPAYVADMSVWQRIAAARDELVVTSGLVTSSLSAAASWGALAIIACLLVPFAPTGALNPIFDFMRSVGLSHETFMSVLFVVIIGGLYAASLSTASTQLIATTQAIQVDVLRRGATDSAGNPRGVAGPRLILLLGAAVSIALVVALIKGGFSTSDLVFAIYGAQLGMVPPVIVALFAPASTLRRAGPWTITAVLLGFASGWAAAIYGKFTGDGNLVFLAPAVSLAVSTGFVILGLSTSFLKSR